MLKNGQAIRIIGGAGAPLQDHRLGLVAALLACGAKYAGDFPLLDAITEDGQREWSFGLNDSTLLEIQGEEISVAEFCTRFDSLEWVNSNSNHPIAYMRALWEQVWGLRTNLKGLKPVLKLQRVEEDGEMSVTHTALISQDASEEDRAKILELFGQ